MENIIEIQHLSKSYGKQRGIVDVSLEVKKGEIFGFIGPNGAGKSTTIRSLLGLIHPDGGSATIFGNDCIKDRARNAIKIGYLPSEVYYYDHMRVKDLLRYSASFYKQDCESRMQELCALLQLDMHRKIADLSYGNRKKVGIVQGLLHSPELIILDEPTSGLDPLMQNIFFDLIREENEKGATIFFSSHILSEVQKLCDCVAIIKAGKILTVKKLDEMHNQMYKHVEIISKASVDNILSLIAGITNLTKENDRYVFIYTGPIQKLLNPLSTVAIEDIDIFEPDLEEVFMHYYQGV